MVKTINISMDLFWLFIASTGKTTMAALGRLFWWLLLKLDFKHS